MGMKTYTKLPPVFRWWDFLSFGMLGVITVGFLVYGLIVGFQGATSSIVKQAPWLMAATAAGFFFVYWRVIKIRMNDIKGFVLVGGPKYGFLVNFGSYTPPGGSAELLSIIEQMETAWSTVAFAAEPVFSPAKVADALTRDYVWVWFKPGTLDLPNMAGKVAGYTVAMGNKMVVGYPATDSPLERTAFSHELGHLIQGNVTGVWDQTTHQQRSKTLHLP